MSNPLADMEKPEVIFCIGTNMTECHPVAATRLKRALAKSPDDRYQTGNQFASALRRAAEHLEPVTPDVAPEEGVEAPTAAVPAATPGVAIEAVPETSIPPPMKRRKRSSLVPWVFLAALVIAGEPPSTS